jgi:uncharacterized protein
MASNPQTLPSSRISAIDTLRGFAVLGILPVNIQLFSMITAAYHNPSAYGDISGANYWVWLLTYSLADSKFLALFSLLFGASLLLIHDRRAAAGLDEAIAYQKRRLAILMAIGLVHAYLVWPGDILVTYALCGLLLLPVLQLSLSPRALLLSGVLLLGAPSLNMLGSAVTPGLLDEAEQLQVREQWQPPPSSYQAELDAWRGGWLTQQPQRSLEAFDMHIQNMPLSFMWRAGGLMLIGMALLRLGILSAQRSRRFYLAMMFIGFGLGVPLMLYNSRQWALSQWSLEYFEHSGFQINYWGGLLLVAGYIGVIMWLCKAGRLAWLTRPLAHTGRMALSSYLLQSLLCTFIFYGHGLGLFGYVERTGQFAVVLGVWAACLVFSSAWLAHFQQGPVEWLWRRLSRRSTPPLQVPA